jgi:hypothetical protein
MQEGEIMTKFQKKEKGKPQEELIKQYAGIVLQLKKLEAEKEKLKDVIFAITQERGGMTAEGLIFSVASKPKYQYPEALEAEIKDIELKFDFIKLKMKRAVADGKATVLDKGEYLVAKVAKD